MKLMIVDDNARIRELVQRLGESSGATVVACEDGSEAAAAYSREEPDWVLMDLSMPGMDGLAATRGLMQDYPEARVILLSDLDTPALRSASAQAGALGYLTKDRLTEIRLLAAQGQHGLPPAMAGVRLDGGEAGATTEPTGEGGQARRAGRGGGAGCVVAREDSGVDGDNRSRPGDLT